MLKAITKAGIINGRQRFAPEIQISIIGAEESAGLARIADLNMEEISTLLQIQQAKSDNNYKLVNKQFEVLKETQKNKRQALLDLHKLAMDNERLALQKAQNARAELQSEINLQEFMKDNEDRMAEAMGSQLVEIDENNEIIIPTYKQIRRLAEQTGIDPDILASQVNARIDELKKITRVNRLDELNRLKFEETQLQNDINNEFTRQRVAISGGNLALAREKYEDEEDMEDEITKPLSFEEFIKEKQEELQISIANPEQYRQEYEDMKSQYNQILLEAGGQVEGKKEGYLYIDQLVIDNPEATYNDLYPVIRAIAKNLSISEVKDYLKGKGIIPIEDEDEDEDSVGGGSAFVGD